MLLGQRQAHTKGRAFTCTLAESLDGAVVRFRKVSHNRQPDAQAGMTFTGPGFLLAEAIEQARQKLRTDALTRVGDFNLVEPTVDFGDDIDPAILRRELDGVAQQIPYDLLQARLIGHHACRAVADVGADLQVLGLRLTLHDVHRGQNGSGRIDHLQFKPHLAESNAGKIQQVRNQMRLHARIALDRFQPLRDDRRGPRRAAKHLYPAQNRIQWIAQFVRERRQEFVLELVAALGLGACRTLAREQALAFDLCAPPLGDVGGNGDARAGGRLCGDAPFDIGDRAVGAQYQQRARPTARPPSGARLSSANATSCAGAIS